MRVAQGSDRVETLLVGAVPEYVRAFVHPIEFTSLGFLCRTFLFPEKKEKGRKKEAKRNGTG